MTTPTPIGIAVLGLGWMGQAHSRSALRIPSLFPERSFQPKLVVCADTSPALRERAVRDFGFERAVEDWREAIASPDVDAVWVTAPNMLHVPMIEAACAAGKAVFSEKPIGGKPEQAVQAFRAAEAAGVQSGVGYNYLWAPLVLHARELITSGVLGEITHYRGRFLTMYGSDELGLLTWRFKLDQGGYGVSSDILSHCVSLAQFLVGDIEEVVGMRDTTITRRPLPTGVASHYGRGRAEDPHGDVENEDFASMLCRFSSGATGTFESSRSLVGPESENAFEVYGTKGSLKWNHERINEMELYLLGSGGDGGGGSGGSGSGDPGSGSGDPGSGSGGSGSGGSGSGDDRGYTTIYGGDRLPFHGAFVPGQANSIGFEDIVAIEDYCFMESLATGTKFSPSFREAVDVVSVQQALIDSWETRSWQRVNDLAYGAGVAGLGDPALHTTSATPATPSTSTTPAAPRKDS